MNDVRVWIYERPTAGGVRFDLHWRDANGKRQQRAAKRCRTREQAERAAGKLGVLVEKGEAGGSRRVLWQAFVDEHVGTKSGVRNATEARRILTAFGKMFDPHGPRSVTYAMLETYVQRLRDKGNAPATVKKNLTYLRNAMRKAGRRGYVTKNPFDGWDWERVTKQAPRVATDAEAVKVLDTLEALYGFRWRALAYVALHTGGRRMELLNLGWAHVDLDGRSVHFANLDAKTRTKSKKDRVVPFNADVADVLRRLKASTMQDGGPFAGMDKPIQRRWDKMLATAKITPTLTLHDLRRTYVTRLIRAGVALPTVQKLAGHAHISTTIEFYNWVSNDDLRAAVSKLA